MILCWTFQSLESTIQFEYVDPHVVRVRKGLRGECVEIAGVASMLGVNMRVFCASHQRCQGSHEEQDVSGWA